MTTTVNPEVSRKILAIGASKIRITSSSTVPGVDCVISIPGVIEFDKSERRPPSILQVDELNLSILVKQVFNVFVADVWRQVADVDPRLAAGHVRGSNLEFTRVFTNHVVHRGVKES